MGRKKFRLITRKCESRKKHPCIVSISRAKLPLQDLAALEAQIRSSGVLPDSWTITTGVDSDGGHKLFLCFLETTREAPLLKYSITIKEDFSWNLIVFERSVNKRLCRALSSNGSQLNLVDKVVYLISTLKVCKLCTGNSDQKFLLVAKRRDGTFMDHSGNHYLASFVCTIKTCCLLLQEAG